MLDIGDRVKLTYMGKDYKGTLKKMYDNYIGTICLIDTDEGYPLEAYYYNVTRIEE